MKRLNVAIVGLGFGAEFIPIYQKYSSANLVAISQRNPKKLEDIANFYNIPKRYTSYEELIKDPEIDAIHLNTPIPDHGRHTIMALKAGKHVACTVPMATTLEECKEIVNLVKKTGLIYMMMETVVYAREFLYIKELFENGELGKIQFLKASHQQDMDGWPDYWPGLPPMHYATHCVAPVVALAKDQVEYVSCFGSGTIREKLVKCYGSPYAVESAHLKFRNSDLCALVYRSLFDVARQYRESFEVYGSKKSVEWALIEGDPLVVHTAKREEPEIPERVVCPDFAKLLPKEIQEFTTQGVYNADKNRHNSFVQGGGHGGSHPHLVHAFVDAILNNKQPYPNAIQSANITCVGILAHESAEQGGEILRLPEFTFI